MLNRILLEISPVVRMCFEALHFNKKSQLILLTKTYQPGKNNLLKDLVKVHYKVDIEKRKHNLFQSSESVANLCRNSNLIIRGYRDR